mmetsp:Transcript_25612/g.39409  ORF Transcript_25612/g.39409 Transcript_25612/m.39409 type:complete len:360 (-) Transcript_25612:1793-2872(-)|eukprot:CAMPEP_0170491488 /NCGR_PEP_ID=MMETSP0208-20121228/11077_1 /TAXON_ID=197538 /ORGANISM="Strombidium inclinatum, Strain S3" /LENGTH=359 /DNA_ID=CAMNT_0010767069 /DNA_START=1277 /DNA_END=2356 /DNA_ORIENTATION=+
MLGKGFNLTELDSEVLDVYVEPSKNWHEDIPQFNLSKLNLTWAVESYSGQNLKLRVVFNDPYEISPLPTQDTLSIHFLEVAPFFISKQTLLPLDPSSRVLHAKISKQTPNTEFIKAFKQVAEQAEGVLKGSMASTFALNLVMAGSLSLLLGMINSLQLIVYLPILSFVFPANAMMLFKVLIPIVTFDILENYEEVLCVFISFFGFSSSSSEAASETTWDGPDEAESEDTSTIPDQMQNLGFDSYDPFANLGTLGLMTGLYFVKVVVYLLVLWPVQRIFKMKKSGSWISTLGDSLFFSEIILIFIEGYIEFIVVLFLFDFKPVSPPPSFAQTGTVALVALLALCLMPFVLARIAVADDAE